MLDSLPEDQWDTVVVSYDMRMPLRTVPRETIRNLTVLTIGHSTRTIEDFIRTLQAYGVTCVVDVRTIPRSRHNPQFNQDCLPQALKEAGIVYVHLPELGGLRHTTPASRNLGWRNASFRGFADYMETPGFEKGVRTLLRLARKDKVALMCAEAVPWACHRSLIADALLVRGIHVNHIFSPWRYEPHALTSFAEVRDLRVTYPQESRGPRARRCGSTGAERINLIRPERETGARLQTRHPPRRRAERRLG